MAQPYRVRGTQCTARSKRSGERCKRLVVGGGVCRMHGGASPAANARRLERIALEQVAGHVRPEPITGAQALQDELSRTHGEVLRLERLLGSSTAGRVDYPEAARQLASERGHLLHVAKAVVGLGLDDLAPLIEEAVIVQLVVAVERLVARLGFDARTDEKVRRVIFETFTDLEALQLSAVRKALP